MPDAQLGASPRHWDETFARLLDRLNQVMNASHLLALVVLTFAFQSGAAEAATNSSPLQFIDTSFENASPVWYEIAEDGAVHVQLLYDHERSSPNRAAGHFHFRLHAPTGSKLTLEFRNLDNVWNGQHGSVARELKAAVISENGKDWTSIPLETIETNRTRVTITMPSERLYMARVEPYRLSNLERLIEEVRKNSRVEVFEIGKT